MRPRFFATPAAFRAWLLAASPVALAFFEAQAPWYQRTATHWVVSAKQEATRSRRLATLVADSAAGRRLAQLSSSATSKVTRKAKA